MPSIRLSKCKVLYLCNSHTHPGWGIQTRKPRLSEDQVCCPTSESDRAKPEFEPRHAGRSWDFFVKIAKMRNSQNIKILLMWCLFCFFQIWELTHNNSNITLRIPSFWVELWASASFPSGTVWIDHKLGPTPQCSYSLCALSTPFLQLRSAIFQPVCCKRHTGVQQEFLQHAIPNQWRALTSFPLDCQTKKKWQEPTQYSSCQVWMNQKYTYFLSDWQKIYIVSVLQNFSNWFIYEKGWKYWLRSSLP